VTPHDDQVVRLLDAPSHDFDDRGLHYHVSIQPGSHAHEVLVDPAPAYPVDTDRWHGFLRNGELVA
jgi:hypothetical protein